jgi:protein phosphatase
MGGAVAGEEASRIAVETIQGKLTSDHYRKPGDYQDYDASDLAELLGEAVRDANNNIISRAVEAPELKGMGTTVTMAFARRNQVILAHVGDSRAYYVDGSDNSVQQLTTDHSFVQALVDAGHLAPEDAKGHPMENVLYRALGQAEDLDVDLILNIQVHPGDRIVLCSDGLTRHVEPEEIAKAALAHQAPNEISDALIELANSRGGKDNISVIVIVVDYDNADTSHEVMSSLETLPFHEDDEPTIPIDPNFLKVSRMKETLEAEKNETEGTPENQHSSSYGEGRDNNFEPFG